MSENVAVVLGAGGKGMPHDANAIIGIVLCVLLVVSVVACVAAFFYELFTNTEHADAAPTRTQEANE